MIILGIWDGHDSGAAILKDGRVLAAVNEERLTRRKLEVTFPELSIRQCLDIAGLTADQVDVVAGSTSDVAKTLGRWLPSTKESYYRIRRRKADPGRLAALTKRAKYRITEWGPNALTTGLSRTALRRTLRRIGLGAARLHLCDHHRAHAVAAALGSGFDPCLVLTVDGVGDGLSSTVSAYRGGVLERVASSPARDSLGIFYEHVTNLLNLRELEDEGKVMALADHTYPVSDAENPCLDLIRVEGLRIRTAVAGHALHERIRRIQWRHPNEQLAYLAQRAVEERLVELARAAVAATGVRCLALSGGVASNIKANRRIRLLEEVDDVFVFPHMGDGGLALGAALDAALAAGEDPRLDLDDLGLGPRYPDEALRDALEAAALPYRAPSDLASAVADLLAGESVVLWLEGRMEYGPRALGHRSVLARPDRPEIRDRLNRVLKRRAWYQPFCPTILESAARELLEDLDGRLNRHMTMGYQVKDGGRSRLAGVTSVDGSCRPQILDDGDASSYAGVVRALGERIGTAAVLNTSFNVHGEPLVCTPAEAVDVYLRSGADALVLGPYLTERPR